MSPFLCAGDGDAVDFEGAAQGAFVIGFGFGEVGQGAQFGALSGDEVALGQDDVVNGGSAELIFLLLGVESLLLQFARLAGGVHLGAVLFQSDGGVADVQESGVFDLLGLRLHLTLDELRVDVVGLSRAVAQGKTEGDLSRVVVGKLL